MRLRLIVLLLASLFQIHQLTQDVRFHPDEALFMTFARNAAVNGDWILSGALDKPPLSIYQSAISMVLIGNRTDAAGVLHLDPHVGEFAGRLPNVFWAILLVALMMRLAHDLYRNERISLFAGLLSATSPYILAFGATAFTDMSLLFWLAFSIWMAVRRKWGWAGIALGLAFWSKQQAIFCIPLILLIINRKEVAYLVPTTRNRIKGFFGAIIVLFFLLIIWDASRPETSIFLLGTINNSPDSFLAPPATYMNRLLEWLNVGQWLIGWGWLTFLMVMMAIFGWLWHWFQGDSYRWLDTLMLLFIVGYISLHTVLAFNQYDRYLLLILPPLILLCARGLFAFLNISLNREQVSPMLWGIFTLIYIVSALTTLHAGIPIGGDKGEHQGIDNLADYLNSKPIATVIYDPWLGWELGYYMGQWTNKRRVHYPTPNTLVEGALALEEIGDRYLVAPVDKPLMEWLEALESAGFTYQVDYQSERFMVYRLLVPASDA